ncbi:MAG: AAA family ATPase, partial [Acidobacteriota bacterium]|nr:AAA family ATPase [Acidobacteriota bacterium]
MHVGNRRKINLSGSMFRSFIEGGFLYVDKSLFIEHVLENGSDTLLFTRPRRMGKSLNLDMLRVFLDPLENKDGSVPVLFSGLCIENRPVFDELSRHPVIDLNFRDYPADAYRQMFRIKIKAQATRYLTKDQYSEELALVLDEDNALLPKALQFLIENIHAVTGAKPFVLIDEYDKLFIDGAKLGGEAFGAIREFTRNVLASALKDNPHLGKGVLTGVNRIAQESMFSELNNIEIHGVLRKSAFDTDFGFTEEEVKEICTAAELKDVREWYNGYRIGEKKVYFTYSVMTYLKEGRLGNYWGQSGVMDSIKNALTPERFERLSEIVGGFGDARFATPVKDRLTADDMDGYRRSDAFYSLLLQSGYLTYDETGFQNEYEVYLPNRELQSVWQQFLLSHYYNTPASAIMEIFGLVSEKVRFEARLSETIDGKLSYFDFDSREPEKTYHVFMLGL